MNNQQQNNNAIDKNIKIVHELFAQAENIKIEVENKNAKELRDRREYFATVTNMIETTFDSQNGKFKEMVNKYKIEMDNMANSLEIENNNLKQDMIDRSNQINTEIDNEREEFKNSEMEKLIEKIESYETDIKSVNRFI